ncbi:MAG: hypothetical protein VX624_12525, partial [Pseudomonadota bacterium]|nr:hypothetical protein [Pseudomonadota bacterium]
MNLTHAPDERSLGCLVEAILSVDTAFCHSFVYGFLSDFRPFRSECWPIFKIGIYFDLTNSGATTTLGFVFRQENFDNARS